MRVLVFLSLFGCAAEAASSTEDAGSSTCGAVVVASLAAGTFTDGIYDPEATCYERLDDGTVDYTACCPVGFEPVALLDDYTVQCLQR